MKAQLRRRMEMAVRVRDFLRAHRTEGVPEQAALARLEELVARADVLAGQQRAGVVASRAATEHRAQVRRALQGKLLRYLTAVGRVAARENAELGAQFRLPRTRGANLAFLTVAASSSASSRATACCARIGLTRDADSLSTARAKSVAAYARDDALPECLPEEATPGFAVQHRERLREQQTPPDK